MRIWNKREEEAKFNPPEVIKKNFIPLSYMNDPSKRSVNIVGTNMERDSIIVIGRKVQDKMALKDEKKMEEYEEKKRISALDVRVDYVIPADINVDRQMEYVVITKESETVFHVNMVDREEGVTYLGRSEVMPFIFCNKNLEPTLFLQNGGETTFVRVEMGRVEANSADAMFGALRKNHSSGFIDVTGNGVADFVLDTEEGGKRYLEVWANENEGFSMRSRFEIPAHAGPVVFGDFTGSGSVDILYLTNDTKPAINIIPNRVITFGKKNLDGDAAKSPEDAGKSESSVYSAEDLIKYELKVEKGVQFVLYNERGPVFPGVFDLDRNAYPDLLLVAENTDDKSNYVQVFINKAGKGFSPSVKIEYEGKIHTGSFYDTENGISDVIIGVEGSSMSLLVAENISDFSGYLLNISSVKGERSEGSLSPPVIGTSYVCRIVETKRVIVGFYPPQSGYSPMQSPTTTIGLGKTTMFIGSFRTSVPSYVYSRSYVSDKIVPNSELLMYVQNKNIEPAVYLNPNTYWPVAIPIILTILLLFGMSSAYFAFKEIKKNRKNSKQMSKYNIHFDAL